MPVFARQLKALDYHSPDAIKLIANHIRTMQEELEYRLAHLDSSNVSEIDASQTNIITKDGDLYTILNTLEDQQAKLEIGYDHILSEVSSYEETVEGYRQEVSRLEQTTDGFRATVEAYETTLEGYEQQLSSYEQTVEGFSQTVAEYKTSVAGYEAKVSEFTQTVDGFSQTVTEYETTLEGYTSQVSGFEQTVDGFSTTVQDYEKDLEGYRAQVSTYEQTVDGFRQEVSSYKEDVNGYKDQVSSFEQTVDGFNTTVSNYESAVSGYAQQVSSYEQTVDGFSQTVGNYEQTVEGYAQQVSGYEQTVDGFTQEVSSYKEDVNGYKEQVSAFEQTVNGFETTVSNYESAVSGYAAQVSKFQQTAAGFEATVSEYTDAVEGYEDALSTTLKMDSKGVYIVDQDGKQVTISGGQIEADSVKSSALHLYGNMTVYQSTSSIYEGGFIGYAKSKQNNTPGMRMASAYAELASDEEVSNYGHSEVHVTNNGAYLRYIYKNVSTKALTTVGMGVYGSGTGTVNAAVNVGSLDFYFSDTGFRSENGLATLGTSAQRWGQIYTNAAVNTTSDREAKNSIEYDIDPRYDELWSLLKPCTGKYNDGTSGRTHMFLVAQDVEEAVEEAGLTSLDFAAYSKSPKEDEDGNIIEGYTYGLRYEEFIPLCIRRIQLLEAKVAAMERS